MGVIGSLLVAGIAVGQTAYWLLDNALRDYMTSNLHDESRGLLKAIKRGPNGLTLDSSGINPAYERPLSGRYFVLTINERQWRSRSLWDEQLAPASGDLVTNQLVDGPNNQRLLWLDAEYERYGESINILVANDFSPILQDIRHIQNLLLAIGILVLVLLGLLQKFLMRRSLRPLEVARLQVEQLRNGSITALNDQVPEELAPLVHEINRLLHDTQQQLHRSRTALGDLSHALKTPLAVLLNLTERDTLDSDPALREAIALQIEQMRQRISREMALARTAGTHRPETLFDVDTDLPLLLESLRRAHRGKMAIDSRVSLQGKIPWEREDVIELLGNLLDNACKWSRKIVRLNLHRVEDQLSIQVDDDGPGIPQDKLQKVLERGERLDESVKGDGLGLAIVGDKVAAYQGALGFASNEEGGLSVRILLPWH